MIQIIELLARKWGCQSLPLCVVCLKVTNSNVFILFTWRKRSWRCLVWKGSDSLLAGTIQACISYALSFTRLCHTNVIFTKMRVSSWTSTYLKFLPYIWADVRMWLPITLSHLSHQTKPNTLSPVYYQEKDRGDTVLGLRTKFEGHVFYESVRVLEIFVGILTPFISIALTLSLSPSALVLPVLECLYGSLHCAYCTVDCSLVAN